MAKRKTTRPDADPHALTVTHAKNASFIGGFYVTLGERMIFQRFDNIVPAKHFILKMIANQPYTWDTWSPCKGVSYPVIRTESGLTIRGAGLEEAVEYHLRGDELDFVFPEPYTWYDTWPLRGTIDFTPTAADTSTDTTKDDSDTPPKKERKPKEAKPERPSKEGLVTVAQIAADNKWDAKHVRAALRKANVQKPEAGWAFPPSEVPAITKTIKENLK